MRFSREFEDPTDCSEVATAILGAIGQVVFEPVVREFSGFDDNIISSLEVGRGAGLSQVETIPSSQDGSQRSSPEDYEAGLAKCHERRKESDCSHTL